MLLKFKTILHQETVRFVYVFLSEIQIIHQKIPKTRHEHLNLQIKCKKVVFCLASLLDLFSVPLKTFFIHLIHYTIKKYATNSPCTICRTSSLYKNVLRYICFKSSFQIQYNRDRCNKGQPLPLGIIHGICVCPLRKCVSLSQNNFLKSGTHRPLLFSFSLILL